MSKSFESIMRELCNEYGIAWEENSGGPMINGEVVENISFKQLLESGYTLNSGSIDIKVSLPIDVGFNDTESFVFDVISADAA